MLNLALQWIRLTEQAKRNDQNRLVGYSPAGYRAKAWECVSLAESVNVPERRADMLRFARMWMSLAEPMDKELRGAYELPARKLAT
jgi:hypothetical protein